MNLFLSSVMFSVKKVSFPAKTAVFTPLNLNHDHNTRGAINHLLDIPQKQTCHYGTYSNSIYSFKNMEWLMSKGNQIKTCYIVNLRKPYFKDFSASMKIITELIKLYGAIALSYPPPPKPPTIVIDYSSWKNKAESFTEALTLTLALGLTLGRYESATVLALLFTKTAQFMVVILYSIY